MFWWIVKSPILGVNDVNEFSEWDYWFKALIVMLLIFTIAFYRIMNPCKKKSK